KTDANGDTLWTKIFGDAGSDYGNSVQQTADGGYIVLGNTRNGGAGINDVWLLKTDANGNLVWKKTFGGAGDEYGNYVQQTFDGGYILTGFTDSFGSGNTDV